MKYDKYVEKANTAEHESADSYIEVVIIQVKRILLVHLVVIRGVLPEEDPVEDLLNLVVEVFHWLQVALAVVFSLVHDHRLLTLEVAQAAELPRSHCAEVMLLRSFHETVLAVAFPKRKIFKFFLFSMCILEL